MRFLSSLTLNLSALVLAVVAVSPAVAATWRINVGPAFQRIDLNWDAVANADHYRVCIATATIADPNLCASYTGGGLPRDTTAKFMGFSKLTNGVVYHLRALAVDAAGNTLADSGDRLATPRTLALNDTGITTCSNNTRNRLPCPVAGFPGQDAESGRDVTQNKRRNGHAGFKFTKISATGEALPANATEWHCVKDKVTGLMWEVKTDDGGLHDKDWIYSWYEPDASKNGGDAGKQNGGSCQGSRCDTLAYVRAVNKASWCGHRDWRLPARRELASIVSLDRYDPAMDTAYFPKTQSTGYWSSSPSAWASNFAGIVLFHNGNGSWGNKSDNYYVRLVRGGQ
jgi:hypothetical protein